MRYITTTILLIGLTLNTLFSRVTHPEDPDDPDSSHKGKYCIAVGGGAGYSPAERDFFPSVHLEFERSITDKLGIGLGYEGSFGEHTHHSMMTSLNINLLDIFDVGTGPGIIFPHEVHDEPQFMWSAELVVPFDVGEAIHLGPMADFCWSPGDTHFLLGIHAGIQF